MIARRGASPPATRRDSLHKSDEFHSPASAIDETTPARTGARCAPAGPRGLHAPMMSALTSPLVGWLLAVAALVGGWRMYGWPGVLLGASVIVFWLLLQFSRALRAVRDAAGAPMGSVRSAVMLNAKLKPGMTLPQVLALTGSLGQRAPASDGEELWCSQDAGGVRACLAFRDNRLLRWELHRPPDGG
jgi:hypothetical protein